MSEHSREGMHVSRIGAAALDVFVVSARTRRPAGPARGPAPRLVAMRAVVYKGRMALDMGRRGGACIFGLALAIVAGCGDSGGAGTDGFTASAGTAMGTTTGGASTSSSTTDASTSTPTPTSSTTVDDPTTTTLDTFDMMTDPGSGGVIMTSTSSASDTSTGAPDPVCGDGNVDPGEECDEGEANDDLGTCTSACLLPVCGDGFLQAGEACDDGNAVDDDACVTGCKLNVCGDGHVGPGEACDDPMDPKCTDECALASCGDKKVQPGEDCDDGNDVDTDACLSTCLSAKCGDGAVQEGVEICDDGNVDETDACTSLCKPPACDDGIKSGGESDVDCGGMCGACDLGKACGKSGDCGSKFCKDGLCGLAANCQEIHTASPMLPNGLYTVDFDGAGPEPQANVECEMSIDGGGWTLVQRTVWDQTKTAALFTGYADWYGKTQGTPAPGEGYRLAGRLWSGLNLKQRHLLIHRIRKATGESCMPLFYVGTEGVLTIDATSATLTGLKASVNMINNPALSTQNSGPNSFCVNQHGGAPWFYAGCCSTCPTFAGSYWPVPHPMANYFNVPDQFASVQDQVCEGQAVAISQGYVGVNDMAYYLR